MMPRLAVLVFCALAAACASTPPAEPGPLPSFPAYKAAPPGQDRILLTAGGGGFLAWQGWCLGFSAPDGGFTTIIWPETARLGHDRRGIFVTDSVSGTKIRVGDYFRSGGGYLPSGAAERIASELTEPVRPECAASVVTVNPGFEKARPPR